jgi:hypothetical protein
MMKLAPLCEVIECSVNVHGIEAVIADENDSIRSKDFRTKNAGIVECYRQILRFLG